MSVPQVTPLLLKSEYEARANNEFTIGNLLPGIIAASDFIQRICGRRFDERIDTRKYTALSQDDGGALSDPYTLQLDDDLRSVTTLAVNLPFGASSISSGTALTSYSLSENQGEVGTGIVTYNKIRLDLQGATTFLPTVSDPTDSIWVLGKWGYGGQWVQAGTVASSYTAGATTLVVNSVQYTEQGSVLKVGSQYFYVDLAGSTSLTVSPAYNGSTAANASTNDIVYFWQPLPLIRDIVMRLVQWRVEQIKAPLANSVAIGDFSYPVSTDGLPKDLQLMIAQSGLSRKLSGRMRILAV
jgi:hypothetical protein